MKHFILGILLLLSTQVWALPAPKQIQDAVHAGQFVQAEQMLREVITAKPNSALAYYELGQILAREQRHGEAVQALQQARSLEPSLKFARSADLFHKILAAEQAQLQQQTAKPAHSPVTSVQSAVHPRPSAATQSPASSHGLSAGLLVLIAMCLIAVFIFVKRKSSREQNERAKRLEQMADQQLSDLLHQAEQVRDAELECRAATYASEKKEFVLQALRRHNDALMQAITQCRGGAPIGSGSMSALAVETRRVCTAARLGELPPLSDHDFAEAPYSSNPGYAAASQEPVYPNHAGYPGGQQNAGSGLGSALGGLAAGVVIGEMLGHHGNAGASERIVEVVEERQPDSADRGSDNWFDFDGSDSNADADWNNDDDSGRDSNNWGGDSDWGSNDSSSFDSGDSGSDDSSW